MFFRNRKNYHSMDLVYTTDEGNEIWLGDYYAATDMQLLKQKNISSVLTAAAMLGVRYSQEHAINHKTINAFDIPTYKMSPHFEEVYSFIKGALKKGNILVHCAAGISRSTTCVLVYLMREKGYGLSEGIKEIRKKRSIVHPNHGFQNELSRYQLYLKKKLQNQLKTKEENEDERMKRQTKILLNRTLDEKQQVPVTVGWMKKRTSQNIVKNIAERRESLNQKRKIESDKILYPGLKLNGSLLTYKYHARDLSEKK